MDINLKDKKILYIGPLASNYDKHLIDKLKEGGAFVKSFDITDLSVGKKPVNKLKNKLGLIDIQEFKNKFYNLILKIKSLDYVLIRHGYQLDIDFLKQLRQKHKTAKFVNFHWDSLKPTYDYRNIMPFFDKIYSFEYKDCQENSSINYLPLFYLDVYKEFGSIQKKFEGKKSDLLFVGSWRNLERFNQVKTIENLCENLGLKFEYYLQFSIKNQYLNFKKGIRTKHARIKNISHHSILNLFLKTDTIIDFPSSFQTGLTIRTFEALSAGKKLITTNKNIISEPFYDPEFIDVIDMNNLKLNLDFIRKKPSGTMNSKLENYSLKNYINKLLK